MIHLALFLSCFIDIAAVDEERLQLGNDAWRNKDEVEDGKEVLLKVCKTIANHPKAETVQERQADVHGEFVINVFGVPEERHVHAMGYLFDLCPRGSCKLVAVITDP